MWVENLLTGKGHQSNLQGLNAHRHHVLHVFLSSHTQPLEQVPAGLYVSKHSYQNPTCIPLSIHYINSTNGHLDDLLRQAFAGTVTHGRQLPYHPAHDCSATAAVQICQSNLHHNSKLLTTAQSASNLAMRRQDTFITLQSL